jgi:hypothetical protein
MRKPAVPKQAVQLSVFAVVQYSGSDNVLQLGMAGRKDVRDQASCVW